MRVISLEAENVLRFKSVRVITKDELIEIKGENSAGKSSLINLIIMAFGGKKEFPDQVIRKGAKKGINKVKIDGDPTLGIPPFTIVQTISEKSDTTKIIPDEFLKGETPRSFLDKIKGKIGFDPWDFIKQDKKKQRKMLLDMIGVDADKMDAEEKSAFDKRTELGRILKISEAKIRDAVVYEGVGTEEIKVAELTDKLQKAIKGNQEITNRKEANERLRADAIEIKNKRIPDCEARVATLKADLAKAESELATLNQELVDSRKKYNTEKDDLALTFPTNTTEIETEIANIESTNSKIRHNSKVASDIAEKNAAQAAWDAADKEVECIRTRNAETIQKANIPILGLTFDADGLLYNGFPIEQCSTSEKLMIGATMGIKLNPTMRVLTFKDGSLLSSTNKAMLKQILKDNDFQCWFEEVSSREEYDKENSGIFIESGEIRVIDGEEITPEKECAPVKSSPKKSGTPKPETKPDEEEW